MAEFPPAVLKWASKVSEIMGANNGLTFIFIKEAVKMSALLMHKIS